MRILNKYFNHRTLGLAAILLAALVSGCSSSDSGSSDSGSIDPNDLTITSTNPKTGAKLVATNSKITATFSEEMNEDTLTQESFTLQLDGGTPETGNVSLDAKSNTAIFKLEEDTVLIPETTYTATITKEVKSTAGKSLVENKVWTFTTGEEEDTTLPKVSLTNPKNDDKGVFLNSIVTATFDKSLDPSTVNSESFLLTANGADKKLVKGKVGYADKLITFTPTTKLAAGTQYTATLTTGIEDLAGNALDEDHSWVFTTGNAVDTTAPEVSSTNPVKEQENVDLDSSVIAKFNELLKPTTVNSKSFLLTDADENLVEGEVGYADQLITFTPNEDLAADKRYTATLTTGIEDLAGNALAKKYSWEFTTDKADTTPPEVSLTNPKDKQINVARNSSVTATFDKSLDPSTVNSESFLLTDADENPVGGEVGYADQLITFKPTTNLAASTQYTATLTTAIKDLAGNALKEDKVWTFTTGVAVDITAPTVISTNPTDNQLDVALNSSVTATFNESLNPNTVDLSSFLLTAANDNSETPIKGKVVYADKLITFTPTEDLVVSTPYTATLTTDIEDLAGNALALEKDWTFTTGELVPLGPKPVNLLSAGDFVILSKSGITNVPTSKITGNIGSSPITAAAMNDITCSEITGKIYGSNAGYSDVSGCFKGLPVDNTLVAQAVLDMGTAYNDAKGRVLPDFVELHAGDISGKTLVPGLYKWGTNVWINSDVTLDGSENDVWIFQVSQDITQANNTKILLTGGALAKNVFWQVAGGTGVAIGTDATFEGIVLAVKGITVNTDSKVNGRLFSQTEVTLKMNEVTQPQPKP